MISTIKSKKRNLFAGTTGVNIFINVKSYVDLKPYRIETIEECDNVYLDGFLLPLLLRPIIGRINRISFDYTSIAGSVFKECESSGKTVFICGSTNENVSHFCKKIKSEFPLLNIIGKENGYFINSEKRKETIKKIKEKKPDVLIVGMGSPLQELFIRDVNPKGWSGTAFTCGGFIHQHASVSSKNYYPYIFNKLNLRWLFRCMKEPKLLIRYFIDYPVFVKEIVKDELIWMLEKK
ncbi:WecB/TagA/CpsF family glycosyltransferase [Thalassospira sp.]|uniref:WecB/TagA/CpsF family glycosyltransferase n=1 Tax=Thalassospira sp. TaxID=1912094 RepID=UPI003AA866B5